MGASFAIGMITCLWVVPPVAVRREHTHLGSHCGRDGGDHQIRRVVKDERSSGAQPPPYLVL